VGFSADGKYLYSKKTIDSVELKEEWLAVYDASTGKQKTSQPTYRNCDPVAEKFDPAAKCDGDKPQIDEKAGKKSIEKIHATHGAPAADTVAKVKGKINVKDALARAKTGYAQVFSGNGFEIKTKLTLDGKLPDPNAENNPTAFYSLELEVTGKDGWTAKQRVHADPTQSIDNGNVSSWESMWIEAVTVAADRRAVGLTFSGKPFVIVRPAKKRDPERSVPDLDLPRAVRGVLADFAARLAIAIDEDALAVVLARSWRAPLVREQLGELIARIGMRLERDRELDLANPATGDIERELRGLALPLGG
jgi:hypothetical protein